MADESLITVEGTVDAVIFSNPENGYTVLDLDDGENLITVVGSMAEISEGDRIKATGSYSSHASFGTQFKALTVEVRLPEGAAAIERYLACGAIRGIGVAMAKKIVRAFGDKTMEIIEKQPEQLATIRGISMEKAMLIRQEFNKVFGMRPLMIFAAQNEIPASYAIKAWKIYGSMALELIKADPFTLCSGGVSLPFANADALRRRLLIDDRAPCRIEAGLVHTLKKSQLEGHSCYPRELLERETAELLNVEPVIIRLSLRELAGRELLWLEENSGESLVYLENTLSAERYIAGRLALMLKSVPDLCLNWDRHIKQLEDKSGIQYADLQKKAVAMAMNLPVMILTGGPGTGKTTTLNAIIRLCKSMGEKVSVAAPTGRAAKRVSELTGCEARTIHRLLGVGFDENEEQKFIHDEKNLLNCDVLIIDETSMLDCLLFESLLKALRLSCRLVIVGDDDQLPPVGIGSVLRDMISSGCIGTVKLTQIFRQGAESLIVTNAHAIISGKMPELKRRDGDFFFLYSPSREDTIKTVLQLCSERLPRAYSYSPLWDIQVLSPMRVGGLGSAELNRRLQAQLNPPGDDTEKKPEIKYGGIIFRLGDKVMQTKNNYNIEWLREGASPEEDENGSGIFNGDIGSIIFIDKKSGALKIAFDDRVAEYGFEQLGELELAYAVTVHKSQGSEFEAVIMPLAYSGGRTYYRSLLYTAVTRAKKLMILVGQPESVRLMVENVNSNFKYTCLSKFIRREMGIE
ncbi:MAG: ATP-dependent RecD-like DNA helicase [Oscillospiraceae bacterium]|jgi:exodeoxyribonuclease V alpha subunit|nr:ATP-dependent RecD-like DNA helicase [Oscillospiraceae bacterium]